MLCPKCGQMTIINRTVMDYEGCCRIRIRICKDCTYTFLTEEWAVAGSMTREEINERIRLHMNL